MAVVRDYNQLPLITPERRWSAPTELPSLRGARRIAVDVETCDPTLSELGPGVRRGGYIAGIAVGVEGGGRWYLPIRHQGPGNLSERAVLNWARAELNAFDGELVGANLIYDLDYLAENGITFPNVRRFLDVQIAEPLLNEHRLSYSLDSLAEDYLGEGKVEAELREASLAYGFGKTNKEIKQNLWRLPAAYVGPYGEGDADLPLRIMRLQEERLARENLIDLFEVESGLIPLLLAMRRRGVPVNIDKAEQIRMRLVRVRDEALARVRRIAGPAAELMAPESFAKALIERGLNVPLTPKTRKPSITKGWLAENTGDELVDAVLAGRRVDYIINTFIDGHVFTHAIRGRIHCEFNQLKSDDGGTIARFSSSNPNLQNIPARDEEIGPLVRGMFEAEPEEEWARLDESQIEYRFLVHYARGPGAAEARKQYNDDPKTDFHKMCANMLGADPEDKIKRKRVKNTNFCKVYGGGVPKLAATFGCSVEEADRFSREYDIKLPFVQKTFEAAMSTASRTGVVRTVLGRVQRFHMWEPLKTRFEDGHRIRETPLPKEQAIEQWGETNVKRAWTYAALNRVLQGSAADLMKKAMVLTWQSGACDVLGAPLITVHDELDLSVPRNPVAEEALAEVKRCMEEAIRLRVPVIAELERGANWGECK